jgi:hypothetical protein
MDIRLPNGMLIRGVPEGTRKEDIARKAIERGLATTADFHDLESETTLLGRSGEFLKGIPRGFASSLATGVEGIGELGDAVTNRLGLEDWVDAGDDNPLVAFGRRSNEAIQSSLAAAPGYEDLWTTKFGDALGSLASFLTPAGGAKLIGLTGKVAKHLPVGGFAIGVGAGEQTQRIQQAREQGIEVPDEAEDWATLSAGVVGLSELAPVSAIMRGLPADVLTQPFMKTLMPRLKSALASGSVEAVQEVTAGIAQNAIEKGFYNPDRPFVDGNAWDELTLGGAAGATADLLLNSIAGRRITGITAQQRELEKKLRQEEADRLAKVATAPLPEEGPQSIAGLLPTPEAVEPVAAARRLAEGVDFPTSTTFTSLDADGQPSLTVRDENGTTFGPQFKDPAEAAVFARVLNEEALNRNVDEAVDLAINQSGQDYSPGALQGLKRLGRRLFHPAENTVTREQVNYAADTVLERGYTNEQMTAQEALDAGVTPQKMTAAQRINARRLRNGQQESNQFSMAEARTVLGDKFGRLAEFDSIPLGANETFAAQKHGEGYMVHSNLGEMVKSRPATATEQLNTPTTRRYAFKTKKEADSYAAYLNGKRNDLIRRSELKDESEISVADIRGLLKSKNIASEIDSQEVRAIAEAITGRKARGRSSVADMSSGERAMLYRKLRSLPAFGQPTRLPVFGLRPYTPAQYRYARQTALERAGSMEGTAAGKALPAREDIETQAGPLSEAAYQQLSSDLGLDARLQRDIEVEQNRARQLRAREQRQAQQTAQKTQAQQNEFNRIMKALRKNLQGYGLDRFKTRVMDYVRFAQRTPAGATRLGARREAEAEGGFDKPLNEIFIAIEAIKTNPEYVKAPEAEKAATLERLAVETLNHEMVHAMRQADLFTNIEWQVLERAARSKPKTWQARDGSERRGSYTEWASELYSDVSPVGQMEEAIAEMVRDSLSGRLDIGGRPKSLLKRIVEFLKGIVGLKAEGYDTFEDIIAAVQRGEVGAREEGPVRTLREIERDRGIIPERGIVPRVVEEEGEASDFLPEGAEVEEPEGPPPKAVAVPGQSAPDFLERRVYHGSPYRYARPDLSRIGTGEGAAAYGWGYYVADSRNVGDTYRRQLSIRQAIEEDYDNPVARAASAVATWGSETEALKVLRNNESSATNDAAIQAIEDGSYKDYPFPEGFLYEIEVDDAVVERMLDWDRPLSEQGEHIQAAFSEVYEEPISAMRRFTGEDLYRDLAANLESQESASERLRELGIPGIRYFDASSRPSSRQAARATQGFITPLVNAVKGKAEREPTRNYVLFDESDIQIVSRNGEPIREDMLYRRERPGQVSWESEPGRTTDHLPELRDAPQAIKETYHRALSKAFLDAEGKDRLAAGLNLPSPGDFEGPGYFEGRSTPGTQTEFTATHDLEARVDAYAAARGILLRQDGVGWHRPFTDRPIDRADANGYEIDIGRPFTEREIGDLADLMAQRAGHREYNPIATRKGVRLIRFDYLTESNLDFQQWVESALTELRLDSNDKGMGTLFRAQTGYLANNWNGGADGRNYLQTGRLAERPDLQGRVRDLVAEIEPRVRSVEAAFASQYGWTRGGDLLYSRRLAGPALRPGRGSAEADQGLILSGRVAPGASTFKAVHYGKQPVSTLEAERFGSGIRGAEARRLASATDPRIKRRVYFYIEPDYAAVDPYMRDKLAGRTQRPEAGLGPHVHTQTFGNILDVTTPVANRFKGLGANEFESAVIDAGYDGYAVPSQGMMVVLNQDVPVSYLGPHYELEQQGIPARSDRISAIVAENTSAAKRTMATHAIPLYSHLASPEAQYIARHPEEAQKPTDDFLRSRLRPADYNPVASAAPPSDRSPYSYYDLATGTLETPSRFQYYVDKVRQAAVTRYARLERLGWTTDLRENLADTSSLAAALMADRALAIVASSIKSGAPVYVMGQLFVVNKNTIPEMMKVNPEMATKLQQALAEYGIDPNQVKSLIEVMAPLYSEQYGNLKQAAQDYAIAQRSIRLNADGKKVPVTPQMRMQIERQIAQFVDPATGQNIIKHWYKDWQDYNNQVITMAERAGVLNDKTAQLWREMSDYYPFYRVAEGGGETFRQGQRVFGGMTAAVSLRKLKGGESPINMDLEEAISLNLSAMIQMSMKNIAQQRITRDLVHHGLAEELQPGRNSQAPVVEFRVAGRKRRYTIFDPLVYESMLPLDGTEVVAFIKHTFGLPATALRELVTRDPGFMMVNLLRDSLSAYVTSGAKLVPIASTFKGLFDGVERLEKMGVVGGYDYANDPDNISEFWSKALRAHHAKGTTSLNAFKLMWDALGRGTTASDAATRNAVFDDVLRRTGNMAEASFQAMEVINFGRRGRSPLVRMLTSVVPFLNARIQGVDLLYRSGVGMYTADRSKNRAQVAAAAIARGSLLMGATALYWLLVSDDDQYKDADDFVRDNNWLIPTPWGVPQKIPIPFEVGLIFKTLPETVLATTYGEKTAKEAKETLKRGIGSTLELSPFQVQFMGPLLEATANYNSFTGRQVVPQYLMDTTTSGLQSNLYTWEMVKWAGKKLNISPMKIQHVIEGYVGTIGQYAFDWADVALKSHTLKGDDRAVLPTRQWYEYPMIKRLVGEENAGGLVQDAYDLYRDVDKTYQTMNSLKDDGRTAELLAYIRNREHLLALRKPMNNVKEVLDTIRRQREMIMRADAPAEVKFQQIKALEEQTNILLRGIVPQLKEAAKQPFFERTFYD